MMKTLTFTSQNQKKKKNKINFEPQISTISTTLAVMLLPQISTPVLAEKTQSWSSVMKNRRVSSQTSTIVLQVTQAQISTYRCRHRLKEVDGTDSF